MNKLIFIAGLALLGFAIFCGVMANGDYHDPIGIMWLILFPFFAGITIGIALLWEGKATKKEDQTTNGQHQEHKVSDPR